MSLGSSFEIGVAGIRSGLQGFERAAHSIAAQRLETVGESVARSDSAAATPPAASASRPVDRANADAIGGLAETVVRLEQHARDVQTAAKVVQAADTVLGALLGDSR